MRLLALLLLAGKLGAACASGTMSYWLAPGQAPTADPCGGYTATAIGSIASSAAYCGGQTMYGPYTGNTTRYDAPASFRTAWEAAGPAYTVEFYINLTATPTNNTVMRWTDTAAVWEVFMPLDAAEPFGIEFRRFAGGWGGSSSGQILSLNTCYNVAVTLQANVQKLYVDNALVDTDTLTAASGTVTEWSFGGEDGAAAMSNGLMYGLRTSNVVRTIFPTVDSSGPQYLSPYIKQYLSPFVPPIWQRP